MSDLSDSVEDAPRSDRPATTRTDVNINKVRDLLMKYRCLTTKIISEELGVAHETICLIVTIDLGKRKLCSRLVSNHLTTEEAQLRFEASGDLTAMSDEDLSFLSRIITEDVFFNSEGEIHKEFLPEAGLDYIKGTETFAATDLPRTSPAETFHAPFWTPVRCFLKNRIGTGLERGDYT